MTRQHIFILAIAALCGGIVKGDTPKSGAFNIDGPSAVSFDSVPWTSPIPSLYTYLWPFAANDLYNTTPYSKYNLAKVAFSAGSFAVTDYGEKSGDLGIRVSNYTDSTQTFEACILTLGFIGSGSFDIYLPEFTFEKNENMFFWVSESGATYYANFLKGVGLPDMTAVAAMAAGDEYLGSIPEPATVLLLGLGSLVLRKFNRGSHKARGDF